MIPTRQFGRTGHESTRIIFGAAALSDVTQAEADATIDRVIEAGVNHFDTAASYGKSETLLGPWVKHNRDRIFLASKTGERSRDAAYDEIRRSLERLNTDHLDLLQLHNLVDEDEWHTVYAPGGALEAAVRAKEEGLVRHIGVTGHGVTVARQHIRSLGQYDFDSVLLPYSYVMAQNPAYLADVEELFELCISRNVAIQTIKAVTRAPWPEGAVKDTSTWYDPLRDAEGISKAMNWVLGNPDVFLNTLGDIHILPTVLDLAQNLTGRPSDVEMDDLLRRYDMSPLFV
jgi:aryl-alcohol dehydrogenase-like predicted oxidoreductase